MEIVEQTMPRSRYFDTLKAIAILCVMYAHCLQYLGIGSYLHHPLFKLVYAFHMPLFMTLSGYFAWPSIRLPFGRLVRKKSLRLLLPCLTAAVLVVLFNRIFGLINGYDDWRELVGNLWYLKSLFACIVLVKLMVTLSGGDLATGLIFGMLAAFPIYVWHVNFMMPFFAMGLMWRHRPDILCKHTLCIGLFSIGLFLLLWPFWDGRHTTYLTPLCLFNLHTGQWTGFLNFPFYLIRLAMGLFGTLAVISLTKWLDYYGIRSSKLASLGQHTLELYTLHSFFIHTGLLQCLAISYVAGWYEIVYCTLSTVVLLLLCEGMRKLIARSVLWQICLFGYSK